MAVECQTECQIDNNNASVETVIMNPRSQLAAVQSAAVQTYVNTEVGEMEPIYDPKPYVGTKTIAIQSDKPPVKMKAPPPPTPETPPLTEARPHRMVFQ